MLLHSSHIIYKVYLHLHIVHLLSTCYNSVHAHFEKLHSMFTHYDTVHTHFDIVHTHFGTVHTLFTSTQFGHSAYTL